MYDLIDFEVTVGKDTDNPSDLVVFFSGPNLITHEQITVALQEKLEDYTLPDHALFLVPDIYAKTVKEALRKDNSFSTAIQRRNPALHTTCGFGYYNSKGQISSHEIHGTVDKELSKLVTSSFDFIIRTGLKSLAKKTQVMEKAPSGFLFSKPSSRSSNYFIRAEALLTSAVNSHFIAFACLKHLPDLQSGDGSQIIYLDTVAFLPVALSIQLYLNIFAKDIFLSIRSFRSYDGIEDNVYSGSVALCLISASTNCNLAKKWHEVNRCDASRIITVLSFDKTSDHCSIVIPLERPSDFSSSDGTDSRSLIRIQGERFVAQHSETKTLNISTKHAHGTLQENFEKFVGQNLFGCYGIDKSESRRTVWVNKDRLVESPKFLEWYGECLTEEVSLSTNTIIYDDDTASRKMADHAQQLLGGYGLKIVNFMSFSELEEIESFVGGALIVAAAADRGSRLLGVSRRLRSNQEKGTRVYMIGSLFGRSYDQMSELAANLTQPARGGKRYSFKHYFHFPASNPVCNNHWEEEEKLIARIISQSSRPPQFIMKREKELKAGPDSGLTETAFWKSTQTGKEMALKKGFAFVDDRTKVTDSSSADIFLTINWVLQNARQSAKIDDDKRLLSVTLQQVLLSPEVFSRYDDGVIQAAFLRGAHPAELDYSEHESYSLAMSDIIRRIVSAYGKNRGEAAMEFVIALGINKIKIHKKFYPALIEHIKNQLAPKLEGIDRLFSTEQDAL